MSDDRKKPGMAFWATVVLVTMLVGYPLSFGPACWLVDWGWMSSQAVSRAYRPIVVAVYSDDGIWTPVVFYAGLFADEPYWTIIRVTDAAGLIRWKSGSWRKDMRHDMPHRSSDCH